MGTWASFGLLGVFFLKKKADLSNVKGEQESEILASLICEE